MNFFNYLTIYTLIDTESMSNFSKFITGAYGGSLDYNWIWECATLLVSGAILAFLGALKFVKKDLPL